jgi:hypothetical protein
MLIFWGFVLGIAVVCSNLYIRVRLRKARLKAKTWQTPSELWSHWRRLWRFARARQLPWVPVVFTVSGVPFAVALMVLGLVSMF